MGGTIDRRRRAVKDTCVDEVSFGPGPRGLHTPGAAVTFRRSGPRSEGLVPAAREGGHQTICGTQGRPGFPSFEVTRGRQFQR